MMQLGQHRGTSGRGDFVHAALCKGCKGVFNTSSGVLASMTSRSLAKDRKSSLSRELLLILRNSSLRSSSAITICSACRQTLQSAITLCQGRPMQRAPLCVQACRVLSFCRPYSYRTGGGAPLASQTHANSFNIIMR